MPMKTVKSESSALQGTALLFAYPARKLLTWSRKLCVDEELCATIVSSVTAPPYLRPPGLSGNTRLGEKRDGDGREIVQLNRADVVRVRQPLDPHLTAGSRLGGVPLE